MVIEKLGGQFKTQALSLSIAVWHYTCYCLSNYTLFFANSGNVYCFIISEILDTNCLTKVHRKHSVTNNGNYYCQIIDHH